ncbi:Crp/Fnr family transcriptional regulator [Ralstonia mojiangensis]|uniref:Crp/Fnr family transcriptional regulator n=1 Tax=Ralstonia mojiangensis TaxID=2953895 RepID=UPI0021B35616|nr:Crp/Fnr family transcriptional regulator [Ralstonia mojiangensis]MCT7325831.1 Crp/Fnr family transcriptional regulator [Ralstonia mojiangensis]
MIGPPSPHPAAMPADATHTAAAPTPAQLAQGWLREAPADLLAEIAPTARLITYPDGECIHPHGGPAQGMFLIVRGRVRISRTTDGGSELVYGVLRAGEWFGEIALIDGGGRTHSAHAQGPTTLVLLGSAAFARVVSAYPAGMWALMQQLCQRIRLIFDEFEHASEMPADARLAQRLLQLARAGDGRTVGASNEELGRMLARSRQTISKYLQAWQRAGWIRCHYRTVEVVDTAALRMLIDGHAS